MVQKLGWIILAFGLTPTAWAHSTYPFNDGKLQIAYYSVVTNNNVGFTQVQAHVTHIEGEQCTVTEQAFEIVVGTPLLSLTSSRQPALDVNLDIRAIRAPNGRLFNIGPWPMTEEIAQVSYSWAATGFQVDGTPNPNCNGSGQGTFSVEVSMRLDDPKPTSAPFGVSDRGGQSFTTSGSGSSTSTGYGRIQVGSGTTPSGLAIFGLRQNNVLVSEAQVPAPPAVRSARTYVQLSSTVDTGLAIANPNPQDATITFSFTDATGASGRSGSATIPADGQIVSFVDQAPYGMSGPFEGTLTVNSSVPLSMIAVRGLNNERGEFLITTLPVVDLNGAASSANVFFPDFADGGGYTTQIVLINPDEVQLTGTIQFRDPSGNNATVTVNGQAASSFSYSIPPRSSQRFETTGTGASTVTGSVRVVPATGTRAPSGIAVFSFRSGGITVSAVGIPASVPASAFRLYAESSGNFNGGEALSTQTGFAIANSSPNIVTVTLALTALDGFPAGESTPVTISIPANGQKAIFLNQSGLKNFAMPFQGVLRISGAGISVAAIRGRYNERGDFLMTATSPVNEATPVTNAEMDFPHLVNGGGYTTQIVLFSGTSGQSSSGIVTFWDQSGQPLLLAQ